MDHVRGETVEFFYRMHQEGQENISFTKKPEIHLASSKIVATLLGGKRTSHSAVSGSVAMAIKRSRTVTAHRILLAQERRHTKNLFFCTLNNKTKTIVYTPG